MSEFRVTQLKHHIRYDDYIVTQRDDGRFIGESRFEDEAIEIISMDLHELMAAIDMIEKAANGEVDTPTWLDPYLSGKSDRVLLPSADIPIEKPKIGDRPVEIWDTFVRSTIDHEAIVRDLEEGRIYRHLPSQIARQYGLVDA